MLEKDQPRYTSPVLNMPRVSPRLATPRQSLGSRSVSTKTDYDSVAPALIDCLKNFPGQIPRNGLVVHADHAIRSSVPLWYWKVESRPDDGCVTFHSLGI